MVVDWIIAGGTVLMVAARPQSWRATAVAVAIAASGVALGHGSAVGTAVHAVAPIAGLLAVALALSGLAVRLGAARQLRSRHVLAADRSQCEVLSRGQRRLMSGEHSLRPACGHGRGADELVDGWGSRSGTWH